MSHFTGDSRELTRVWARVDLDAYVYNVKRTLKELKQGAALCAVVKANAYGHGAVPVSRACLAAGAQRLAVVTVREGLELREAGIEAPIQLLGPCLSDEVSPGIEGDLTFAVSSEDEIALIAEKSRAVHQGRKRGRRTRIHLNVDTGMGRGGFAPDEVWPAAERVLAEKTLDLEGVFTHFSSAEEPDRQFSLEQISMFRRLLRDLEEKNVRFRVRHAANSAAALFYPESQLDLVRVGALLHGCRAWDWTRDGVELRPALSVHTRIVHLGKRPAGWTVGYNRLHRCTQDSILATLPVGYRDGYRRALTGRSEVLIRGRRVPVVGTISMDYIVVDVTALANAPQGRAQVGDEAILIGSDPLARERITVEDLARASGTIPYVVTTQLGVNVERRYVGAFAEQLKREAEAAEEAGTAAAPSNTISLAAARSEAEEGLRAAVS
ncbi:MAG: alanine racemase [Planctomycetota bacterium]|nr:alanine racemase [Planctomycetota bacterium]